MTTNHAAGAAPAARVAAMTCFRGADNLAYYRVEPGDPGAYYDTTGCGNSLVPAIAHPLGDPRRHP